MQRRCFSAAGRPKQLTHGVTASVHERCGGRRLRRPRFLGARHDGAGRASGEGPRLARRRRASWSTPGVGRDAASPLARFAPASSRAVAGDRRMWNTKDAAPKELLCAGAK